VKVKGIFTCNELEMVELRILRGGSRAKSKITMLDFRRPD